MFVRISVLLLSLGLVSCNTAGLVDFGIRGTANVINPPTVTEDNPDTKIHSQSPLVCTKAGEDCKVMKQIHANKLNLSQACDPEDTTDCWYYEKPKT